MKGNSSRAAAAAEPEGQKQASKQASNAAQQQRAIKMGFALVWNKGVWPKGVQPSVGCHGGEVAS